MTVENRKGETMNKTVSCLTIFLLCLACGDRHPLKSSVSDAQSSNDARAEFSEAQVPDSRDLRPGEIWDHCVYRSALLNEHRLGSTRFSFTLEGSQVRQVLDDSPFTNMSVTTRGLKGAVRGHDLEIFFRMTSRGALIGELTLAKDFSPLYGIYSREAVADSNRRAHSYVICVP